MKITEALNTYKKDNDRFALYEALYSTSLKFTETREILKDTLKEGYSEEEYLNWKESKFNEYKKSGTTFYLEKEEWDDMDDTSFDDIFDDLN
jgi:hypothetical protein